MTGETDDSKTAAGFMEMKPIRCPDSSCNAQNISCRYLEEGLASSVGTYRDYPEHTAVQMRRLCVILMGLPISKEYFTLALKGGAQMVSLNGETLQPIHVSKKLHCIA